MKKILVTGSNGLLGQKLVYKLRERNDVLLIASSRGENRLLKKDGYEYEPLDISNEEEVNRVFAKHKPDVIINAAAMTNVDACETRREEARAQNVDAVRYMVNAIANPGNNMQDCHFIHVSTDFIFDGTKGSEYTEEDKPNPQSFYALTKLEGENIVRASKIKWSIARTIIVYGVVDNMSRSNIVLWVKNSLEKGQNINVITDQYRSPTLAEDLADGCISLADKSATGIFNLSGPQTFSIWELAEMICDFWKLDRSLMKPVTSEELNQPAKRPLRTGFVLDKARKLLGYDPHTFKEGLRIVDEQIKHLRITN
jgi:dTDP-4-dehydrorhamnose reductase